MNTTRIQFWILDRLYAAVMGGIVLWLLIPRKPRRSGTCEHCGDTWYGPIEQQHHMVWCTWTKQVRNGEFV